MIKFYKGDVTSKEDVNIKQEESKPILLHIVNDIGAWGAGVVVPIGDKWPTAKDKYKEAIANKELFLGEVQYVPIENSLDDDAAPYRGIYNMCAQAGITSGSIKSDRSPIRYWALDKCLKRIHMIEPLNSIICCPKFGSGLAGGHWDEVEYLIHQNLSDFDVRIFELK